MLTRFANGKKNAAKGREVLDGERGMFLFRSGGNGINPYAFARDISNSYAIFLLGEIRKAKSLFMRG
jgi:hypothetical protein